MRPLGVIGTSDVYDLGDLVKVRFHEALLTRKIPKIFSSTWTTDSADGQGLDGGIPFEVMDKGGRSILFEKDGVFAYIHVYRRGNFRVDADVAANTADEAAPVIAAIETAFPKHEAKAENAVTVKFWMLNKDDPRSMERDIVVPPFAAVRDNYPARVTEQIEQMISPDFEPGRGGQLLLWHGLPGTGKTYALRALANAWSDWCTIEYVTDPEKFFGEASYLMPVILSENDVHDEEDEKGKWRLLIFEDTGELLSQDARERTGQGLSRLLNVVDGFIGQGLRTLILITTNEEISKLHEAVQRPGRCAVSIKYDKMSAEESQRWAKERGFKVPAKPHTVAELYAAQGGQDTRVSEPFGFQPRVA